MLKFKYIIYYLSFFGGLFFANGQEKDIVHIIQGEDVFLVDVRTPQEFERGSVKNAVNIPVDDIEKYLFKFKDKKNIILFCRSGRRSERAKQILEKNGIKSYNAKTVEEVKKHQR